MAHGVDADSTNANYGSSLSHGDYYDSDVSSSNTGDPTESDRAILLEEEQQESLLATEALSGAHGDPQSTIRFPNRGKREHRKERKRQRKVQRRKTAGEKYQEGNMMYEMEDREPRDNVGWHSSSSSLDRNMLKQQSKSKVWAPLQDRGVC